MKTGNQFALKSLGLALVTLVIASCGADNTPTPPTPSTPPAATTERKLVRYVGTLGAFQLNAGFDNDICIQRVTYKLNNVSTDRLDFYTKRCTGNDPLLAAEFVAFSLRTKSHTATELRLVSETDDTKVHGAVDIDTSTAALTLSGLCQALSTRTFPGCAFDLENGLFKKNSFR